ncbi:MAG TPA: endonuclease/exonuclease/phosphatase family protein [Ktedonobacterales bacterium]
MAEASPTFGLLTYNILAGGGPRLEAIEAVIRASGADIVGLQEAQRSDLLERLADRLGMHHTLARVPSGWRVAALSRWPLLETRVHTGPGLPRALLEVLVALPDGGRLRFFVTHLSAAFRQRRAGEGLRLAELDGVLERMRAAREAGEPHALVGDFNSLAPGERLAAMGVLRHALAVDAAKRARKPDMRGHPGVDFILPPVARPVRVPLTLAARVAPLAWLGDRAANAYVPRRVVQRARDAGYTDCYAALHPNARTRAFTCPLPAPAGRIDYVFASPALAPRLACCEVLLDAPGQPVTHASDHRPVLARFRLDPA